MYGATVARLTPDQKVGSSNLSALTFGNPICSVDRRADDGSRAIASRQHARYGRVSRFIGESWVSHEEFRFGLLRSNDPPWCCGRASIYRGSRSLIICANPCVFSWTLWPSGLRRWLKAPFRKGVGSNPTGVTFSTTPSVRSPRNVGGIEDAPPTQLLP